MIKQLSYILLFSFFISSNNTFSQVGTTLLDDFNRTDNTTTGGGWSETETASPGGCQVLTNMLRMGSTTAGRDFVYQDMSLDYATILSSNTSTLTWSFNMRNTRTDPSGFDASNYGVAFVIGATLTDFNNGSGYAVILGNSGASDNLRFVRFNNGLDANANITNIITPANDLANEYLTIKVIYNPASNTWELFLKNDGTTGPFTDPNAATYTSLGTGVDNTYTGSNLAYLGCYWNHATGASDFAYFDNVRIPSTCVPATEPTVAASSLVFSPVNSNDATISWTNGNGTARLVVIKQGSAVTALPTDGASYAASTVFGSGTALAAGEYVVYSGTGNSFTVTNLIPNTTYHIRIFEYDGSTCSINYFTSSSTTGNFTTPVCVISTEPTVQASVLSVSSIGTNSISLSWVRGNGANCIIVAKAGSAVTTPPSDGTSYTASSIFGGGSTTTANEYVVYSGNGTSTTVTGLNPGTTYYFSIYEFNGNNCSANFLLTSPSVTNGTTPAAIVYNYYYGNIHSHSDYSDGDQDNVCATPLASYNDGDANAINYDFMGISDHNHGISPSVMTIAKYQNGVTDANTKNLSGGFVALYGMEWGTISTGGHVLIYGIDSLIGWETSNYQIYNNVGNYNGLFAKIAARPSSFAWLAHPDNTHFNNIFTTLGYTTDYDDAISGICLRNGPAFSTNTTYSDPSFSDYEIRYLDLLKKGYHVGVSIDQDNHNATHGRSSQGRTIALATSLSKNAIMDALENMRTYASDDYNVMVDFKINATYIVGNIVIDPLNPTITVNVTDPNAGDNVSSIQIYYGVPGSGTAATLLTSAAASTLNYTHSIAMGGSYYYFAKVTQTDGNIIWSSPIWYTKNIPLGVNFMCVEVHKSGKDNKVQWTTTKENKLSRYIVEVSENGSKFDSLYTIIPKNIQNETSVYQYTDISRHESRVVYYRIKALHENGEISYSQTVSVVQQDVIKEISYEIYPNPVTNTVFIQGLTEPNIPVSAELYTESGEFVDRFEVESYSNNDFKVDLSKVSPKGVFILKLYSSETVIGSKKIVKW